MPDREKLIRLLKEADRKIYETVESGQLSHPREVWEIEADHLISKGVTVRERGRWIQRGKLDEDGNGQYYCSVCSAGETHNPIVDVPYCWKCGADMRTNGEGEEDG